MLRRHIAVLALSILFLLQTAAAQDSSQPASRPSDGSKIRLPARQPDDVAMQQAFENLPWAVKLGLRSLQVDQAFPLIDRVVLVPDVATYVDELAKWSPVGGRWPVLIEDQQYAPMFVRRFNPAQLIRREPVGTSLPQDVAARQKLLESNVIHAFGGDPAKQTIRDTFTQQHFTPAGVVITSVDDPSWTAAVALAAGRGEPLAWLNEPFGGPNEVIGDATVQKLISAIDVLVAQQGYSFDKVGDDIDTITICRAIAVKAEIKLPPIAQVGAGGPNAEGPTAITDLIGRHHDASRYAFAGWIFGDEVRSAYMAMCSLFLPRERALLYDTYPAKSDWSTYGTTEADEALKQAGYTTTSYSGKDTSDVAWLRQLIGGLSTDFMIMNSKGNYDFFDLSSGTCYAPDVPILNQPIVLHLVHSWSMTGPAKLETVGGQWLDHGAYAAIGSAWEPYLNAFIAPSLLTRRLASLVPFLIAARYWDNEGPFSKPWRIVTIGDPLMLCGPIAQCAKLRINKPAGYGVDLIEKVKDLMRKASTDNDGAAFNDAMRILDLLGKDEIAEGLWTVALSKGKGAAVSRAALAPLFRMRNVDQFMQAWDQLPSRDAMAATMLWHLLTPRLGPTIDPDMILQLQSAIRQPSPLPDLERLAPHLAAKFGNAHAREIIEREMAKVPIGDAKQKLGALLEKYR